MKINTVNVIEVQANNVQGIRSFSDDPEGNKEAEALFWKVAKANGAKGRDKESALEDGYWSQPSGMNEEWTVYLTHSS